jgi:hypothetical protein
MTDFKTSIDLDDTSFDAAAKRVVADNQKMVESMQDAAAASDKQSAATARVAETTREVIPAVTGRAAAFDRLVRKQDEVYDAEQKIAKATRDAEAAISKGTFTREQATAQLARYVTASNAMRQAALSGSTAFGTFSTHLAEAAKNFAPAVQGSATLGNQFRSLFGLLPEGSAAMRGFGVVVNDVQGTLSGMTGSAGLLGRVMSALGPVGIAAATALGTVVTVMGAGIAKAAELERAHLKLEAVLKATGHASGLTAEQVEAMVKRLTASTMATRAEAEQAATVLATFEVPSANFERAIKLSQDLSTTFGVDLPSAARTLGRALEAPAESMNALRRMGVQLSQTEKQHILDLIAAGQAEQAQAAMLDVLTGKVGGAGAGEASGLTGAMDQLGKRWNAFLVTLRGGTGDVTGMTILVRELGNAFAWLTSQVKALPLEEQLAKAKSELADLQRNQAWQSKWFGPLGASPDNSMIKDAQDRVAALQKQIDAKTAEAGEAKTGEANAKNQRTINDMLEEQKKLQEQINATIADRTGKIDLLRKKEAEEIKQMEGRRAGASPEAVKEIDKAIAMRHEVTQRQIAALEAKGPKAGKPEVDKAAQAIDEANRQADADERLAQAAGVSAAAVRKATEDNKVAEFAAKNAGAAVDKYREAIERQGQAEAQRQLNTQVLALTQQADAEERVAAVAERGAKAIHDVTLANQAYDAALKLGLKTEQQTLAARDRLFEQMKRLDAARTTEAYAKELQTRQDALQVDQLSLSLIDQSAGKRAEAVAALQEELRLKATGLGYDQKQIDTLVQMSAADAKIKAQIAEQEEDQKQWAQIAKQGITDIVSGLQDVITHAKTWKEALKGIAQSLGKMAQQKLVEQPMSKMIDKWMSGESTGDMGSALGPLAKWLGLGGDEETPAAKAANAQVAAAGKLNASATALGQSGAAGQLGKVPDLFSSILGREVGQMNVNAANVNVAGGTGGGGTGGAGSSIVGAYGLGGEAGTGAGGEAWGGSVGGAEGMTAAGDASYAAMAIAKGAAFDRGGQVVPFASGGVVERPTSFRFAQGTGLMGEAGPEAVLPLRRTRGGALGVIADGKQPSGGHTVNVNVVVNGNDQAAADRFRRTAQQAARDALQAAEEQKRRFG